MPVIVNEDGTDAQYMCDICGVEIQDQTEGTCCPTCGRILAYPKWFKSNQHRSRLCKVTMAKVCFVCSILTSAPSITKLILRLS